MSVTTNVYVDVLVVKKTVVETEGNGVQVKSEGCSEWYPTPRSSAHEHYGFNV